LRDEIKQEVMARAEGKLGSPGTYPEWAQRIRFYGDARVRYQGNYFPTGNDQAGAANYNAINTGAPYDVTSLALGRPTTPPDRNQFRFRGRLGMEATCLYGFTAGCASRLATTIRRCPPTRPWRWRRQLLENSSLWLDRATSVTRRGR